MMDNLSDVIWFFAGTICMGICIGILWLWHDWKYNDYIRGYQDAIDDIFDELKEYEDET